MVQTLAEATKSNVQEKAKMSPELQKKLVCEEVLDKLGTVKDFYKIDAKNVYYNKWRVDVWTVVWKEGMWVAWWPGVKRFPGTRIKRAYEIASIQHLIDEYDINYEVLR